MKYPLHVRFWKWLKEYSENKHHESLLNIHKCDQKCQFCNTWQSTVGGWKSVVRDDPTPYHDTVVCNKCKQKSILFDFGMGYAAVDENHHTITEYKVKGYPKPV